MTETLLRDGTTTEDPRLDRLVSPSWEHLDKYPLTAQTMPSADQSMVIGVNWYSNFDAPQWRRVGRRDVYTIGEGDLGHVRGGHAVCLRHWNVRDVAGWGAYYNQGREGRCHPPGTYVRLADGSQRRIEDVRLLDQVATAEGRTGVVTETMVRRADTLLRVRLRGHFGLRCTPSHPLLTERGYVEARDLQVGDRVAVTRYLPADSEPLDPRNLVDMREFRGVSEGTVNTGGVMTQIAALPAAIERSPEWGRLVGLYAAEGSTTANKVVWSFGSHEHETLVPETVDLIKRTLGAVARVQVRPNNLRTVVVYGKHWRRLFEALVPGTSRHGNKHLSGHVTAGPPDYLRALLEGWLDGDGHRRRQGVQGITVCKQLALDMHAIANGLGLAPTLAGSKPSVNRHAATRQFRWDVGIARGITSQSLTDDAATWRKVVSVDSEDYDGWVYNLEVEGDHSYVADGIGSHNCVEFACLRERSLANRVRYDITSRVHYWMMQREDYWEGGSYPGASPVYEGTSVRAGQDVMHAFGPVRQRPGGAVLTEQEALARVREEDRTQVYRWATSWADVRTVLRVPDSSPGVPLLNSWGRNYPREVLLVDAAGERLLSEDGEFAVVTDQ